MACHVEPCGCDESNALREMIEDLLVDTAGVGCPVTGSGCPSDCMCSRNRAYGLLERLATARAKIAAAGISSLKFINITFTIGDDKPKQGEFKWE